MKLKVLLQLLKSTKSVVHNFPIHQLLSEFPFLMHHTSQDVC